MVDPDEYRFDAGGNRELRITESLDDTFGVFLVQPGIDDQLICERQTLRRAVIEARGVARQLDSDHIHARSQGDMIAVPPEVG